MSLPRIGITMGDPTGIGPEIVVKALMREEPFQACRPVVFGDEKVFLKTMKQIGRGSSLEVVNQIPEKGYAAGKIFLFSTGELNPCQPNGFWFFIHWELLSGPESHRLLNQQPLWGSAV